MDWVLKQYWCLGFIPALVDNPGSVSRTVSALTGMRLELQLLGQFETLIPSPSSSPTPWYFTFLMADEAAGVP